MDVVSYAVENGLSPEEFRQLLIESTLGERRPVNDPERIADMVKHANLVVTARIDGILVGVARSVSDYSFCTYLSDLAVHRMYQRKGIGKELIRQTKIAAPKAKLILLSAPAAVDYYPRIGMIRHEHCFFIDDLSQIR